MRNCMNGVLGAMCAALAATLGCADTELLKKDQEIKALTQKWQQSASQLSEVTSETAVLSERLAAAERSGKTLEASLEQGRRELTRQTAARGEFEAAITRLRERNYDLEMTYETLSERVRDLRAQVEERNGRVAKARDVIAELNEKMRQAEDAAAKALAAERDTVQKHRTDLEEARRVAGRLETEVAQLTQRTAVLEKDVAQMAALRQEVAALTQSEKALKARLSHADGVVRDLRRNLAGVTAAAQAAGTALPAGLDTPTDWTLIERMLAHRWERAKQGEFAGDTVDWVLAGTAGGTLILVLVTLVSMMRAVRRGRELRRWKAGVAGTGDPQEESGTVAVEAAFPGDAEEGFEDATGEAEEYADDLLQADDLCDDDGQAGPAPVQAAPQPARRVSRPASVASAMGRARSASPAPWRADAAELFDDESAGAEALWPSETPEAMQASSSSQVDDAPAAVTEVLGSGRGARRSAPLPPRHEEDFSSTQVIEGAFDLDDARPAPPSGGASTPAGAARKKGDDLLGDLRDVINKKFEELLNE